MIYCDGDFQAQSISLFDSTIVNLKFENDHLLIFRHAGQSKEQPRKMKVGNPNSVLRPCEQQRQKKDFVRRDQNIIKLLPLLYLQYEHL